uniref:Uncharacterized protein n=2 Tax=Clytia hemisphaerica TaxID=252671 RepID=A0A7M5UQ37_9CNID
VQKVKHTQNKQYRQEISLTKTLVAITTFFLLVLIWQCITQCFWMRGYGIKHDVNTWNYVQKVFAFAKLGVIINAATNWIFLCGTCSVFRKELRKFVGWKRRSMNNNSNVLTIQGSTG